MDLSKLFNNHDKEKRKQEEKALEAFQEISKAFNCFGVSQDEFVELVVNKMREVLGEDNERYPL